MAKPVLASVKESRYPVWVVGTKKCGEYTYLQLTYQVFSKSGRQEFYKPFGVKFGDSAWHKEMLRIILNDAERVFLSEVAYPEYYDYSKKLYEHYDSLEPYKTKKNRRFKFLFIEFEKQEGDEAEHHAVTRVCCMERA
jgi:hypothetical protein